MMVRFFILISFLFLMISRSYGADISEPKECYMDNGTKGTCYRYTLSPHASLNIMVINRKFEQGPQKAPIFLLAGGPGQGAVSSFGSYVSALKSVNENRDIVLVDQLGTGNSSPFKCDPFEKTEAIEDLLNSKKVLQTLVSCGQQLEKTAHSIVPLVGTDAYIEQLKNLADALSYKTLSLYGVSYGTRVAVRFAHLYPQRIESMVLEGVAGNELLLFNNMVEGVPLALKSLDERHQQSGLPEERNVEELIEKIKGKLPQLTKLRDPATGKLHEVSISALHLHKALRIFLYDPMLSSILNVALENARQGDFQAIFTPMLSANFNINQLHMLTVACSEDYDEQTLSAKIDPSERKQIIDLCSAWPKYKIAEDFHIQKPIKIPTLLLNGSGDPATPITYAERLEKLITPSKLVSFKNFGHNVFYLPCSQRIVIDFFSEPNHVQAIDTSCSNSVYLPTVFYSNVGPL